ncbi:glycoside hydrolase family protein [Nonlabens marinus]|uniref:Uncharacterized protein n=1 Tax=Nonlabens marinus S1-08 TaxID=1454201 RepID=W8VVF9_9FLAO|nr:hypothetical protein [Nonlabens marinus]BAO55408.1 hypothetical protein NMS_1399 [Nonlabens marinus S1-08]
MEWIKQGNIFKVDGHDIPWVKSHACVPTAFVLDENRIRIYYAPRNDKGQSIPTFFDVSADDPSKILYVHKNPIMSLGELGTFDDGGNMPCCVVRCGELIYLYYVGWNPSVSVAYRNAIGLAVSKDGGVTFKKMFKGALLDRNRDEPFFTASPWVMRESDDVWHMWYASSTGFLTVKENVEPLYVIKYAHSRNGIDWIRENKTCINPLQREEANARATVLKENGIYKMWFAYRGSQDFRDGKDAYRIGYAESFNAIDWKRNDKAAGISYSPAGWDSTMQTYPNICDCNGKRYLFYNGNGFGASGIGYAIWKN